MPRARRECNETQIRNPATGRCVKRTGKIGRQILMGEVPPQPPAPAQAPAQARQRPQTREMATQTVRLRALTPQPSSAGPRPQRRPRRTRNEIVPKPSTPKEGTTRPRRTKNEIVPKRERRIEMATAILAGPSTPTSGKPRPQRRTKNEIVPKMVVKPSTPTSGMPRPQRGTKTMASNFKGFIVPPAVRPLKAPTTFVVPPIDVLKDMKPNIPSFILDPKLVSELKKPKAPKKTPNKPRPTVPYDVQQKVMKAIALPQMNIPTEQRVFTSAIPMIRPNLYPRAELQQKVPKLGAEWGFKFATQIPKIMRKF